MNKARRKRVVAGLVLAVCGVVPLASFAIAERPEAPSVRAAAAASDCKNAREPVRQLRGRAVRKAVLCLVNGERRRHARQPVVRSKALQRAAQRHAKKMAATDCLSHQCPGEGSLASRIRRSGYPGDAKDWEFAENTGCGLSAEAMVKNWMASRYHRINILDPKFEDLGIGYTSARVQRRCKPSYGTFAAVFALRE